MQEPSVLEKIKSGEFVTREECGKSNVWTCYRKIYNSSQEVQPFVMCIKCEHIFKYNRGSSPSNLRKHRCFAKRDDSESSSLTSLSSDDPTKKARINISEDIKKNITNKCVQYVAQDLRSFAAVSGSGFKDLARSLVETGVRLGSKNFEISDILPHPTTVSRAIQKLHNAELERFVSEIQPLLEKGKTFKKRF